MADSPASGVKVAYVPVTAIQIRAIGLGAGGTLTVAVDPGFPLALTQAQISATQSLVVGTGVLWAARPSAVANPGMLLQVSDIGGAGGMLLRSDGSNWYPLGGSAVLFNRSGSLAAPVASLTSAGAAILMGAPLAGLKIPAGLLVPGRSKLRVEGYWNKTGAAGAINCIVCFGTTNSFSDTQSGNQFIGAAATAVWRQFSEFYFHASNAFTESSASTSVGSPAGATGTPLRNTNIDTTQDQYMNWGTTSSSAGDGLQMINVTVTLFQ